MNNNEFILMFERLLSKYTGAPYVALTDSCTNAIFLTIQYLIKINYFNDKEISGLKIPKNTYVGVAQQIIHCGMKLEYESREWNGMYKIGGSNIYDAAVGFKKNMYVADTFQCLSFQQKKKLAIGKGGAVLCDDEAAYKYIKRISHDGRDSAIAVKDDLDIILGWHMNMTPEQASSGILLLNQLGDGEGKIGCSLDYPDISGIIY